MLIHGDRNGEIVHISQVERGLACGCVCPSPACRGPLVAHKGEKLAQHFKHFNGIECEYAAETSLHFLAKELLNECLELLVPAYPHPEDRRLPPLLKEGLHKFASARSEVRHDAFVPDTVITLIDDKGTEHVLLVEFTVTHRCGPEKLARVANARQPMIEIDLSKVDRNANREELLALVVRDAPRKWLNCPKGQDRYAAILATRERAAAAERERKMRNIRIAKQSKAKAPQNHLVPELTRYGLNQYVGVDLAGDYVFGVSNRRWQSEILQRFILEEKRSHPDIPATFLTKEALSLVKQLISAVFQGFMSEEEVANLQSVDPSFNSPYHVVESYLDHLKTQKVRTIWAE